MVCLGVLKFGFLHLFLFCCVYINTREPQSSCGRLPLRSPWRPTCSSVPAVDNHKLAHTLESKLWNFTSFTWKQNRGFCCHIITHINFSLLILAELEGRCKAKRKKPPTTTTFIELFCLILMTFTLLTHPDWHIEARPLSKRGFFFNDLNQKVLLWMNTFVLEAFGFESIGQQAAQ